jgi:hypothetical protein
VLQEIATCVACLGTGRNSKGDFCFPCEGSGKNPKGLRPNLTAHALAFGDRQSQQERADLTLEQLRCRTIETNDDYRIAGEWLVYCKARGKEYEQKRKAITAPMNEAKREVDSWFKPIVASWQEAERILKSKLQEYSAKQLAERQAIARQMQNAQGDVPATMALAVDAQKTVIPEIPNVHERKIQRWRVIDEQQIPRQFWRLDEQAINQAMREQQLIPGIEYYQDTVLGVRT